LITKIIKSKELLSTAKN